MPPGPRSSFRDRASHPLAGVTVLQIVPDLEPGGVAYAAIGTAAALSRAGASALIASRGGRLVSELQARGGLFTPFPAHARNPVSMALNVRRLAQLIASERVDVVHARSRASAWVAYAATRLTRTPFVTSFRGSYARGGPLALRYNSIMARGDVVIAEFGLHRRAYRAAVSGRAGACSHRRWRRRLPPLRAEDGGAGAGSGDA